MFFEECEAVGFVEAKRRRVVLLESGLTAKRYFATIIRQSVLDVTDRVVQTALMNAQFATEKRATEITAL